MVAADVIIAAFGITTLFPAATMTTAYAQKANKQQQHSGGLSGRYNFLRA